MIDTSQGSAWPPDARVVQVRGDARSPWMRRVKIVLDLRREAERAENLHANGVVGPPPRTDASSAWDGDLFR